MLLRLGCKVWIDCCAMLGWVKFAKGKFTKVMLAKVKV